MAGLQEAGRLACGPAFFLPAKGGIEMGKKLESRLRDCGVELIDESRVHLGCSACGQVWSPNIQPGGRMPRGYWKCPNGCNLSVVVEERYPITRNRSKRGQLLKVNVTIQIEIKQSRSTLRTLRRGAPL